MKLDEIKKIAKQHGIKVAKMKKEDLIQAIQLAEGNQPCFLIGKSDECPREDCLWHQECQ